MPRLPFSRVSSTTLRTPVFDVQAVVVVERGDLKHRVIILERRVYDEGSAQSLSNPRRRICSASYVDVLVHVHKCFIHGRMQHPRIIHTNCP